MYNSDAFCYQIILNDINEMIGLVFPGRVCRYVV